MNQGTNLTARVLRQTLEQLGIQQIFGCAYTPQSQGAIERFHQTLKSMIKTYVFEHKKDWDTGLQFLMYAARSSVQESLGFSPNELVFAHPFRGPLRLLRDLCIKRDKFENVLSYISKMRTRLREAVSIAHETLPETQRKRKDTYDVDTVQRYFSPGDQVMVLLLTQTDPLHVTLAGHYVTVKNVSTPDRRKRTQYCHVNMIKIYYPRSQLCIVSDKSTQNGLATPPLLPNSLQPQTQTANCSDTDGVKHDVMTIVNAELHKGCEQDTLARSEVSSDFEVTVHPVKVGNSQALADLPSKLGRLAPVERDQLSSLIEEYKGLFPDVPGRAKGIHHDVDFGDSRPIKQHPYRVGPVQKQSWIKKSNTC